MSAEKRPDHAVFDFKRNELACRHCGAAEPVMMPINASVLVLKSNAFLEQHEGCVAQSDSEAAFLDATAKDCRSCSCCQQVPCEACQAGGVCDEFECRRERADREDVEADDGDESAEDCT